MGIKIISCIVSTLNMNISRARDAVMEGSSCLSEPAAAFLGLQIGIVLSSLASFKAKNAFGHKDCLTVNVRGLFSFRE